MQHLFNTRFAFILLFLSLCTSSAVSATSCSPNPCLNSGSCNVLSGGSGFNCTCALGYEGVLCGTQTNNCASSPCLNGGTCTNQIGSYSCACASGYVGSQCQTQHCNCANGFVCVTSNNNVGFTCLPQYCSFGNNPCQNNGACVASMGGLAFQCRCDAAHTGQYCEYNSIFTSPMTSLVQTLVLSDSTSAAGGIAFQNQTSNFNASNSLPYLSLSSDGKSISNWNAVKNIAVPTAQFNQTNLAIQFTDNELGAAYFLVLLTDNLIVQAVNASGAIQQTFGWSNIIGSNVNNIFYGSRAIIVENCGTGSSLSECRFLPFCSAKSSQIGCDGFSLYGDALLSLTNSNVTGFLVTLSYYASAQAPTSSALDAAEFDEIDHDSISADGTRTYGYHRIYISKSWFADTVAPPSSGSGGGGLSIGAIIGIVLGAIFGTGLLGCIGYKSFGGTKIPKRAAAFGRSRV